MWNTAGLGNKQILSRICCSLHLNKLLLNIEKAFKTKIRIVTYHRVLDSSLLERYPFDRDLVETTCEEFDAQLRYLSKHFDVIRFTDLLDCMDGKSVLPKSPLLITMDDGFSDNYEYAFPIIKANKVPVTIMLSTDYIGGAETFWYDWLAFIVFNIDAESIELCEYDLKFELPSRKNKRRKVFYKIMGHLKSVSNKRRLDILNKIRKKYGSIYMDQPDNIKKLSRPMTWDNVKEMSRHGVDFGSHTLSHPLLSKVPDQQLEAELSGSKRKLEQEIGKEVTVIAYPNGQKQDFNDNVKNIAQEAGYRIGLSYVDGADCADSFDPFEMKRIHVYPHHDMFIFKMNMTFPNIF